MPYNANYTFIFIDIHTALGVTKNHKSLTILSDILSCVAQTCKKFPMFLASWNGHSKCSSIVRYFRHIKKSSFCTNNMELYVFQWCNTNIIYCNCYSCCFLYTGWSLLNEPKIFVNISGCTYLRKPWDVNFFPWHRDILWYIFQTEQYCI